VSADEAVVLSIFDDDGTPGVYLADGKRENGPVSMEEVTGFVQEGLQSQKKYVIIKSDKNVTSGFMEDVARAAADTEGGDDLQFFVAVQDKR
jgi:biopolymer transport protein ExbD